MEIQDIKKKDSGTYNVTATNEHGTQQVAATLIVTSVPEEAEDWKAALKHRFVALPIFPSCRAKMTII